MKQQMKKFMFMKKCLTVWMVLAVMLAAMAGSGLAWAADSGEDGSGSGAGSPAANDSGSLVVTSYTVDKASITKGTTVTAGLHLKHTGVKTPENPSGLQLDISRLVDSFSGGQINYAVTSGPGNPLEVDISISGLTYSGSGKSLKLMVGGIPGVSYTPVEVSVVQAKEYEEPVYEPPQPTQPEPIPAPMIVISRNELSGPIKAKEERMITVYVKNVGDTTIKSPIISFTPSEALLLPGSSSSIQMNSIAPGKTESVQVKVQAMETVASASQYLEAEVKFHYYNRVSTVEGSGTGKISIPATVTKEKKEDEKKEEVVIDSPVPNIIIQRFDYGGASVAAGSAFDLTFQFTNTSGKLKAENVVVTVDGGEGFTLNGSSNTFYFDSIKPGKSKSVTVPMKALISAANGTQPVSVNFKYEYVDNKKRVQATTDAKITVPTYQPDRFEISLPTLPVCFYEGEEVSVTMNYVNKSRGEISNVAASLEGDVDCVTPVQNIGNLEAGKSGTIAFAVTAWQAGEAEFTIKVTYEDGNGEEKVREFPVVIPVEAMEVYDPVVDEPMPEEPGDEGGIKWPLIAGIAAVVAVLAFVIIKKRRKAIAAKKEAEMWDRWDDDMTMSENSSRVEKNADGAKAADAASGTDSAGGEEGK